MRPPRPAGGGTRVAEGPQSITEQHKVPHRPSHLKQRDLAESSVTLLSTLTLRIQRCLSWYWGVLPSGRSGHDRPPAPARRELGHSQPERLLNHDLSYLSAPYASSAQQRASAFDLLAKGRRPKTKRMPGYAGAYPSDGCADDSRFRSS